MKVPLLVSDFLDRAVTVFADRVGVIDEPTAADSLGEPARDRFVRDLATLREAYRSGAMRYGLFVAEKPGAG